MPVIFISYRRQDSPDTVKLIHEQLKQQLLRWEVFYDHKSLRPGEDYPELLRLRVTSARAVLVVIGPKWLEILKQRANVPGVDHVREEVGLALTSGSKVIPVMVGNVSMPTEAELAAFPDLQLLARRTGRSVRPDPYFDADIAEIVHGIEQMDPIPTIGAILAGRYTLTAEIGRGGMGVVYAAQQNEPVRRPVAVKLIKPGMDSLDVLARFDTERQALAVMNHPNIAKVLDAGMADSSLPYFVMEYVRGGHITQYCDQKKLTAQQRIALIIPVCNAVQHAHQKGIIHRDLKPSNVLVEVIDGKAVPKVIDFGLAKALGHKLTAKPQDTDVSARVGTLEYSAPEQAAGRSFDVDTRSDIYSLGVLLYELLTGAPPFTHEELLRVGEKETLRIISEVEPTKPSRKLSSSGDLPAVAANRSAEPKKLTRLIHGDLDWIVMKCLAKDNALRYDTANQLACELEHFLLDEPIQARPPSIRYRIKKFLRRNRVSVAVAGFALALVTAFLGLFMFLHLRERSLGLARGLLVAEIDKVPDQIDYLDVISRWWADPELRQACALESSHNGGRRLRASLALLPVDPTHVEYLSDRLLDAEPAELPVIRDALAPYKGKLIDQLWTVVAKPDKAKKHRRLRAGAALAAYDPESQGWAQFGGQIVDDLVSVNPVYLGQWSEAYRPVKARLLSPLSIVFRDRKTERAAERSFATILLTDYATAHPQVLADLLMDSEEKQFLLLFPKFKDLGERGVFYLTREIERVLPSAGKDETKEDLAKRQANAGIALLKLNQTTPVWPLLKHTSDPRTRSYIINRCGPLGVDASALLLRLEEESDVTIQRALILALGEYSEVEWPLNERDAVVRKLKDLYRTAADPGLHGASEWLLRIWNHKDWLSKTNEEWTNDKLENTHMLERIEDALTKQRPSRRWYVNSQGQTMVVIPDRAEFLMGSHPTEPGREAKEIQHRRHISRIFAIAAKPVTKGQILRVRGEYFRDREDSVNLNAPLDDCPAVEISWYDAAEYCNWLSKHEGIPQNQWCYEPNKKGEYAEGMRLVADYLKRKGYRLPTEAEMEYSCRAGAATSRFYGETEDLLSKYALWVGNFPECSSPVGTLKPNDFGLFDMLGNVWNWCQEAKNDYPKKGDNADVTEDTEDRLEVGGEKRVQRGSSFDYRAPYVRCAYRSFAVPSNRSYRGGFRVARTLQP
jgi:serine/threonine protein kinase/formylglycine-generating enzyme required for sulfatase activity